MKPGFWRHPAHLVIGLVVWSLWFVVVYTGLSLGCQLAPPAEAQGPFNRLTVATLLGGVAVALMLVWAARACWRVANTGDGGAHDQARWVARVSAGLYLLSGFAALAIVLPGLVLAPCL